MFITIRKAIIAHDQNGIRRYLWPSTTPLVVSRAIPVGNDCTLVTFSGSYIEVTLANENFAIMLDDSPPVFTPCQPYIEIGDYRVRWYRNGCYYDTHELPAKFLVAK